MSLRIFLGSDSREQNAYKVAEHSLRTLATVPVHISPLDSAKLQAHGLLYRPTDSRGQRWDLISGAPMSTEFAISRFLTFFLGCSDWCLFADSDIVALGDVAELFALADPQYAVMVVQHQQQARELMKMDGQLQTYYDRKNWSSVMLINCDHPANRRLSLHDVNARPGRDLHAFYWLNDSEIGSLPPWWNWLVNVEEKPERPGIAHFTLGGPWFPNWPGATHDDIWHRAWGELCADAT